MASRTKNRKIEDPSNGKMEAFRLTPPLQYGISVANEFSIESLDGAERQRQTQSLT